MDGLVLFSQLPSHVFQLILDGLNSRDVGALRATCNVLRAEVASHVTSLELWLHGPAPTWQVAGDKPLLVQQANTNGARHFLQAALEKFQAAKGLVRSFFQDLPCLHVPRLLNELRGVTQLTLHARLLSDNGCIDIGRLGLELLPALPGLKALTVLGNYQMLTRRHLAWVTESCPALTSLTLRDVFADDDADLLEPMSALTQLKALEISAWHGHLRQSPLRSFHLPTSLEHLMLDNMGIASPACWQELSGLPGLDALTWAGTSPTASGLATTPQAAAAAADVAQAQAAALAACPKLRSLTFKSSFGFLSPIMASLAAQQNELGAGSFAPLPASPLHHHTRSSSAGSSGSGCSSGASFGGALGSSYGSGSGSSHGDGGMLRKLEVQCHSKALWKDLGGGVDWSAFSGLTHLACRAGALQQALTDPWHVRFPRLTHLTLHVSGPHLVSDLTQIDSAAPGLLASLEWLELMVQPGKQILPTAGISLGSSLGLNSSGSSSSSEPSGSLLETLSGPSGSSLEAFGSSRSSPSSSSSEFVTLAALLAKPRATRLGLDLSQVRSVASAGASERQQGVAAAAAALHALADAMAAPQPPARRPLRSLWMKARYEEDVSEEVLAAVSRMEGLVELRLHTMASSNDRPVPSTPVLRTFVPPRSLRTLVFATPWRDWCCRDNVTGAPRGIGHAGMAEWLEAVAVCVCGGGGAQSAAKMNPAMAVVACVSVDGARATSTDAAARMGASSTDAATGCRDGSVASASYCGDGTVSGGISGGNSNSDSSGCGGGKGMVPWAHVAVLGLRSAEVQLVNRLLRDAGSGVVVESCTTPDLT